jgi:hypothetical protein
VLTRVDQTATESNVQKLFNGSGQGRVGG